ncbi:MAG: peptidoglycan DD-metalloendopeptidase family protein [Deltaproteobacteria bacterium]|nr:peptidoglycan DD-metalloendopeptidase family protein [Candidatus Anaeroferrophillus wilburensis]MBN2889346.1 peptidoglycan DD-metalloendopeptidase family protein [Deltaproteobacteria bacterium]
MFFLSFLCHFVLLFSKHFPFPCALVPTFPAGCRCRCLSFAVAVVLLVGCPELGRLAFASGPDDSTAVRLEQVKKDLQQKRREEASVRQQEESLLDELDHISRQQNHLGRELTQLRQQLEMVVTDIDRNQQQLQQVNVRLDKQRELFYQRLRSRYKRPPMAFVEVILARQESREMMHNLTYLKHLLIHDHRQMTMYSRLLEERQQVLQQLEEQRRQCAGMEEVKRQRLASLEENIAKKNKLLYKIKGEKSNVIALVKELEAAAGELERIISKQRQRQAQPGSLKDHKGRLPMPAKGVVVKFFGLERDRRFKTVTENKGIDIEAPAGSEVQAIFPGQVVFASWLKGYGNLIIIDHGDGYYSIYGHLLEFKAAVQSQIQQLDIIGSVGETDSLIGPSLYFEIRKHGQPLDPLEWVTPMGQG